MTGTARDPDRGPDRDPDPGPDGGSGRDRLGAERLLAFSDGVVAIALTLLVLPLADLVPESAEPHGSGLELLTGHLSTIGSFLLSFAVIGRFWIAHHRLFDRAPYASPSLVRWNLLWLLTIVVMPFPTEMVAEYGDDPFTVRFYVATLCVSSAVLTTLTLMVGRTLAAADRPLLRHDAAVTTTVILVLVLVLVLVVPQVGYWPLLVLALSALVERLVSPLADRLLGPPRR